jgi:hypothetical protein
MMPDASDTTVSQTTRGLQQFLYDSVAEQCPEFPNVTDVDCSSIAVSLLSRLPGEDDGGIITGGTGGSGNSSNGNSTVVGITQKSRTVGAGGIFGIIIAGLIVATLLAFFIIQRKRRSEETSSLQHLKLVDDEDPKERDLYLEDMEIATNSVISESPPRLGAHAANNVSADSGDDTNGLRVMVVNEIEDEDSLPSGNWEITPAYSPSVQQQQQRSSPNTERAVRQSETALSNLKQDVHHCNSATCTICVERRRLEAIGGISGDDDILVSPEEVSMTSSYENKPWRESSEVQFISASFGKSRSSSQQQQQQSPARIKSPKSPKRRNFLPKSKQDDQREYYADDTVDL